MANEERGEFGVTLAGVDYVMRPSWEAIEAIEAASGMMLVQMMFAASNGALPLRVSAIIVTECVKAWGREVGNTAARGFQLEAVTPLVMEAGIINVQTKLAPMLTLAVTGGLAASGERKPPVTSPTPAAEGGASKASPGRRSAGGRGSSGGRRQSSSTRPMRLG